MNHQHLGETFRQLRVNRHISLKQVAGDGVSLSQLSRFERGESDLSLSKFLLALRNIQVEVKEFMDAVNGYQHTEQIRFSSALIDLEYRRDVTGFRAMQAEEAAKFRAQPDKYHYHLNTILLQGFICKCDERIPFPKGMLDEVCDYLFATETWQMYELTLIGNLYLFIDLPLLDQMGREILKRKAYYREIGTYKNMVTLTLLNIWETCIHRSALEVADFYRKEIAELIKNETKVYERTIYLFLCGLAAYQAGQVLAGIADMQKAIQIFDWLDCPHLAQNYRKDFEKFVK